MAEKSVADYLGHFEYFVHDGNYSFFADGWSRIRIGRKESALILCDSQSSSELFWSPEAVHIPLALSYCQRSGAVAKRLAGPSTTGVRKAVPAFLEALTLAGVGAEEFAPQRIPPSPFHLKSLFVVAIQQDEREAGYCE